MRDRIRPAHVLTDGSKSDGHLADKSRPRKCENGRDAVIADGLTLFATQALQVCPEPLTEQHAEIAHATEEDDEITSGMLTCMAPRLQG